MPVSIAYDQIQDVGDYVAEQRGGAKESESLGWFLRLVRRLRRSYGEIHLRFGEPLSLARTLGPPSPGAEPEPRRAQPVAAEARLRGRVRINRATPITPTSLVTLALLGAGDRALTAAEVEAALADLLEYVRRRRLPTTVDLESDVAGNVQRTLDTLVETGVVTSFAEGPEAVYAIGPDQHLAAAYYRNTIIHFFVTPAIAELSLLRAATARGSDRRLLAGGDGAARPAQVRVLLRREGRLPRRAAARAGGARRRVGIASRRAGRTRSTRCCGACGRSPRTASCVPSWRPTRWSPTRSRASARSPSRRRRSCRAAWRWAGSTSCSAASAAPSRSPRCSSRPRCGWPPTAASSTPTAARVGERRRDFARQIRASIRRIDAIDALAASRKAGLIE